MNPIGKKFISLFLVFFLMMLSVNLYAKRRGTELIITKKNGQLIAGELITAKENSILVLGTIGKDVSIDIADIEVIRIVKKSKALLGGSIGFLVGAGGAAFIGLSSEGAHEGMGGLQFGLIIGLIIVGPISALIGVAVGAMAGKDEVIYIEGMSPKQIDQIKKYLRKKARIRDYR